jgi:flagellar hook-length control protein FliK
MTASLLFSQAPYQTQPPDIERGMIGDSGLNHSVVSKTYDESSGNRRDSFLNTLEKIAKDNKPNKQTQGARGGKSTTSPATGLETGISETTKQLVEDLDNVESQINPDSNLAAVITFLEKLVIYNSAGGSSSANKMDEILGNAEDLAALKMHITRLEQNDFGPSDKVKAALVHLQQFIVNAQTGNASSQYDGNLLGELTDSRSTELADLNQLMKKIVSGQENQRGSSGIHMGKDGSGEKLSDLFAKIDSVVTTSPNDIRQTGSIQPAENLPAASRSEIQEKTDSIKSAVEARLVGLEATENAKKQRPLETVRTDASGLKDGSDTLAKTGGPSLLSRISSTNDSGKQFGGDSAQLNLPNNESSPVSKMIQDAQLAKENHMRMDSAMSDELGGKIKVDAGTNESGLLNSQNQTADKAPEATFPSRQTDTSQDSLRTQTLDQIVRKAVIYVRNGQHEAKIDLKPEFLGHVRMQVITENHQVTVKILTEFGFVKDMLENNIHQLKADLQQQGLNVDKLEVAVSSDADEYKNPQEKADQAKERQRSNTPLNPGNRGRETREQAGNFDRKRAGTTTVDYFA